MKTVFLLWHIREFAGHEDDEKFIGVFESRSHAEAAIRVLRRQPGFCEEPNLFRMYEHIVGAIGWSDGFGPVEKMRPRSPRKRCRSR